MKKKIAKNMKWSIGLNDEGKKYEKEQKAQIKKNDENWKKSHANAEASKKHNAAILKLFQAEVRNTDRIAKALEKIAKQH